jgi:hypothetical protein
LSGTKFRLLAKGLTAVLIPCLLAATVYYASFINLNSVVKPAFAFRWVQGTESPADLDFSNRTLQTYNLGMALVLQNGTEVHIDDILWDVHNTNIYPSDDPEFNGTIESESSLSTMSVSLENREYVAGNASNVFWNSTMFGGIYYTMNTTLHTTLSTDLVTSTNTFDLGSYAIQWLPGAFDASNPGSIGYWPNASKYVTNAPSWFINSVALRSMLQGSGNATIELHAACTAHVDYTFFYPDNTSKTGETDSYWNGTMGTFDIGYNENGIYQMQYDWTRITFALVPMNNS